VEVFLDLGDTSGKAGDVVEVPVVASTDAPLVQLRLAFEVDPSVLVVESFELDFVSGRTGEVATVELHPTGWRDLRECLDENQDGILECVDGVPAQAMFRERDGRYFLLDVFPGSNEYPGGSPFETGRLKLRIREDAKVQRITVSPSKFLFNDRGLDEDVESGGWATEQEEPRRFTPSLKAESGLVTIGVPFLRGDSNADGKLDLTDAVVTLLYLFQGGEVPECLDGADTDDSGQLEITDAIFLLGVMFLGGGPIPPPYPVCGADATVDDLGCLSTCRER
jgi:hypothetical protein